MTTPNDWNSAVIKEFRENGGKVGGHWELGAQILAAVSSSKMHDVF